VRLVVFDLDHTLLIANSSFRFGAYLYRHHFYSLWSLLGCVSDYARHKWMGMSIHDLHMKTFVRLFAGRSLADVRQHVTQFLAVSLDPMLYPPVMQRLRQAQAQGDYVVILSSSPDFLVGEIAQRLQILYWKATVYRSDEKGILTAISQVLEGEDKAHYLKELAFSMSLPSSAITVYSDSYLDLPILKMAGKAIGVGPDSHLKQICLQNGWEIL
jgi:HAD superfamily hydrolase (TIGR01490 family)